MKIHIELLRVIFVFSQMSNLSLGLFQRSEPELAAFKPRYLTKGIKNVPFTVRFIDNDHLDGSSCVSLSKILTRSLD